MIIKRFNRFLLKQKVYYEKTIKRFGYWLETEIRNKLSANN